MGRRIIDPIAAYAEIESESLRQMKDKLAVS